MEKFNSNQQSLVISSLRFPMTFLVVCIHFNILLYPLVSKGHIINYELSWIQYPISLFSEVLGRISVPFFFFVSGYLFFWKEKEFNIQIYIKKMRSRFHSLFIPYVSWWIIAGILTFFFSELHLSQELTLKEFIGGFWFTPSADWLTTTRINVPLNGPLWFIRDLMVIMILSPVIYIFVMNRKFAMPFLSIMILLYILIGGLELPQYFIPGLSFPCIFFFSMGAYMGLHKMNILNVFFRWRFVIIPSFILFSMLDTYYTEYITPLSYSASLHQNGFIHHALILLGIPAVFIIFKRHVPSSNRSSLLSASSFTIFALHKIIIVPISYIVIFFFKIGDLTSPYIAFTLYYGIILLVTLIGVIVYTAIRRIKVIQILLTGGR